MSIVASAISRSGSPPATSRRTCAGSPRCARFGERIKIAADANGQWTAEAPRTSTLGRLRPRLCRTADRGRGLGGASALAGRARCRSCSTRASARRPMSSGSAAGGRSGASQAGEARRHRGDDRRSRRLSRAGVPFMIGQMNEGGAATAAALHVACATPPAFAELYGADGLVDDRAQASRTRRHRALRPPTRPRRRLRRSDTQLIGEFGHQTKGGVRQGGNPLSKGSTTGGWRGPATCWRRPASTS